MRARLPLVSLARAPYAQRCRGCWRIGDIQRAGPSWRKGVRNGHETPGNAALIPHRTMAVAPTTPRARLGSRVRCRAMLRGRHTTAYQPTRLVARSSATASASTATATLRRVACLLVKLVASSVAETILRGSCSAQWQSKLFSKVSVRKTPKPWGLGASGADGRARTDNLLFTIRLPICRYKECPDKDGNASVGLHVLSSLDAMESMLWCAVRTMRHAHHLGTADADPACIRPLRRPVGRSSSPWCAI
jgi:hypothetical protein